MIKADIVEAVFEKVGLSRIEAQEIVEFLFETIKQTLAEGESVKISGFGTFNVKKKNVRRGRNPKTGEELQITPRKVISFKPSNHVKRAVEKVSA